jgi:hypothetical protein
MAKADDQGAEMVDGVKKVDKIYHTRDECVDAR